MNENNVKNTCYYTGPTSSYNFYTHGNIGIGSASNSMKSPYVSYYASTRSIGRGNECNKYSDKDYVKYISNN